ncbi:MAG: ABC transporter substrate-binding protein [Planctomycetes bacterium]|nr:ABC transporter substrate-binding protein [Planctomycetota bacterium]
MSRPAHHRLWWLLLALLAAAALLLAAPPAAVGGEEPAPAPAPAPAPEDGKPADPGPAPSPAPAPYGAVPRAVEPWRGVGEPYFRYFMQATEFKGAGREDPEPKGLDAVKIGLLAPLYDHPDVPLGTAMKDGMVLAVEEGNAAGGYRGLPFALVERNDLPLWGASSNMIVDLAYNENVWAILGSVEGNSTHILLRVALKIEIPIVNTADTDPTLMETNIPWIVRVMPDDRQECYRLFRRYHGELGLRRALVLRTGERFGRIQSQEFIDSMRRAGSPVVADLRYRRGGVLPEGTVEKIRETRADGILLWGNGDDLGRVVKALRAAGVTLPVFGTDRMMGEAFLREAGDAAEGATVAVPYDPDREDPKWREFQARFRKRYGKDPDIYASYGARLLLEAIRTAGLNRVRIRDWLYGLETWDGAVTGPVVFDPVKSNLQPAVLAVRRGGKWVHEK